ncbi:sensor histidine kinase [Nocardiopsis potens]|uniref:sensor histidine kinase n=1 Tax=Nocardiopsis potens TaxID=1246458 RepID=UPI000347C952|nr:histidine kinase [Nocardiopsis potens]
MTSEQTEKTQGRLRKLNLEIVAGAVSAVGALLVATDAESWWDALLMAVGLVVTLAVISRWSAGGLPRIALPGLIATAAVWAVGVLAADASTSSYGFAVVATVTVLELPRHRRAAIAGIAAFAAALIGAKLALAREGTVELLLQYVLVSACVAVGGAVLAILGYAVQDLLEELEKAREREAEMAVMRERVRFAGDLHDIQGHTLHVVKLKATLAQRLLRADTAQAERELEEVRALIGDTIARTRELAYAQRRLNLSAELENAKNLFEAAGIGVHVDRGAGAPAGELLGQVLREAATNILRHAQAEQVWITLTGDGITVVNDGAPQGGLPRLSGLAALRDRVAAEGGELAVEQRDGLFRTAATLPRRRPGAAPTTRKDDR